MLAVSVPKYSPHAVFARVSLSDYIENSATSLHLHVKVHSLPYLNELNRK